MFHDPQPAVHSEFADSQLQTLVHTVGTVPKSIMNSLPVMKLARAVRLRDDAA
jgi:hypothetical protein